MGRRGVGSRGDVMPRGNLAYVDDPASSTQYPWLADTARVKGTGTDGSAPGVVVSKEEFIFYPGASAITDGMVASGSRTGAGTVTTAGTANSTYWGPESIFAPLVRGKVDGVSTGGVLSGQLTIGMKVNAATAVIKVTARIRNNSSASSADAGAWVTCLTLSGTAIACTTAEIYRTYDMPRLQTTGTINSIPFGVAVGAQSEYTAGTAAIVRIMESSYIQGWVEPTT